MSSLPRPGDSAAGFVENTLWRDKPWVLGGLVEEILPAKPHHPGEQCRAVIRTAQGRQTISWPLVGR